MITNRTDAVRTEVRKLTSQQAGARCGRRGRAGVRRAARAARADFALGQRGPRVRDHGPAVAAKEYDKLASHGERVLHHRPALNGKDDSGAAS